MTKTLWHQQSRHLRDLHDKLLGEGFEVTGASRAKHWTLYIQRGGREASIMAASTPANPHRSVEQSMKQARKALPPVTQERH